MKEHEINNNTKAQDFLNLPVARMNVGSKEGKAALQKAFNVLANSWCKLTTPKVEE